eukprot:gene5811-9634_t
MKTFLRQAGMNDIKFGAYFPYCSNLFNMYLDLRSWSSIGKIYTNELSIEFPKICVSDFGIIIPYTQICFNIDDIILMPHGVEGSLRSDIGIGLSSYQYNFNNLTFYDFKIGESESCLKHKNEKDCKIDSKSDRKADLCKFCSCCNFFYHQRDNQKLECLQKNSCGWCESSKICYPGDDLGPFVNFDIFFKYFSVLWF